jgi:hypothetical protein
VVTLLRSDLAKRAGMSTAHHSPKAGRKAKTPRHDNNGTSRSSRVSPEKVKQSLVAAVVDQVAAVFMPEK